MIVDKAPVVLIIEDNKMFQDMAFDAFVNTNRMMADNAEEGLSKFKKLKPDITILDIGLPDRSGLDILPEMIEHNPEAFIVMLTQSNIKKDVEKAKAEGAIGYISKPFSYSKVNECMTLYKQHKEKLEGAFKDEPKNIQEAKKPAEQKTKTSKKKTSAKDDAKKTLFEKEIHNVSLLFVDDYPSNRFKAEKIFSKMGCNIKTAQSGAEALETYKKHLSNIILMDSSMKGMDGYETTKQIRIFEKKNNIPRSIIIAMPDYKDEIDDNLWLKAGMDTYITKPVKTHKVRDIIQEYIENKVKGRK